ncbi:pyruvate formate lyase activating enzyme [Maridesulfovibrio ferrireducens]|uniref:Pyruvate formate lyase activating enzyme n=1 Tax=Maridesulfovibrio ferrireducens TaxID=246191 RepID=A0A1G9ASZ3_9BACT|nr:pyruvate formate lyase activating enzyme [Maridesulfovibrio ferrireducens]
MLMAAEIMMSQGIINNIQRMSVQDGPGLRTTVFFKGCPLKCRWCSNPESQSFQPQLLYYDELCVGCGACAAFCPEGAVSEQDGKFIVDRDKCIDCGKCVEACPSKAREMVGKTLSVEDVMDIVCKDSLFYENSNGGVTLGGGECTSGGDFFFDLANAINEEGFHLTIDTCGFCAPARFDKVIKVADLFLFDMKHMDPEEHKRLTGQDNKIVLRNLRTALESGVEVTIRVPLMPNLNDSDENIGAMAEFLKEFGKDEIEVMPCHAFGRNKYAALGWEYLISEEYAPEQLEVVLGRFAHHGLRALIV